MVGETWETIYYSGLFIYFKAGLMFFSLKIESTFQVNFSVFVCG
jgi:hypothetical protein